MSWCNSTGLSGLVTLLILWLLNCFGLEVPPTGGRDDKRHGLISLLLLTEMLYNTYTSSKHLVNSVGGPLSCI